MKEILSPDSALHSVEPVWASVEIKKIEGGGERGGEGGGGGREHRPWSQMHWVMFLSRPLASF